MSIDPGLLEFATDRQREILQALINEGSHRKAAVALGVGRSLINSAVRAVEKKAAQQGYSPAHDMTKVVPEGYRVRGISTYYDKEGDVRGQWVKSERDKARQQEMFEAMVEAMTGQLPPIKEIPAPIFDDAGSDLLACYLVSDHHFGMLAWNEETGADYDLKIAEQLLKGASDHLIAANAGCRGALVVFMGDFLHYDSFEAVTPTSRNLLDADSRYPRMVRAAIRGMRYTIEAAARTHSTVHVIVEIGNHDLSSSIFLMECLRNIYEGNPRITIDTSPMHYHYFRFGKALIGTHHGHGTKMKQLPLIMAHDRPEEWGATEYRYWWTGHIHHDSVYDEAGVRCESFRILAPNDAWAAEKGYRASQDMKAIIIHKEFGEVGRTIVNPAMLKGKDQ